MKVNFQDDLMIRKLLVPPKSDINQTTYSILKRVESTPEWQSLEELAAFGLTHYIFFHLKGVLLVTWQQWRAADFTRLSLPGNTQPQCFWGEFASCRSLEESVALQYVR